MTSDVVTAMNEIRLRRFNMAGKINGVVNKLMRMVNAFETQSVDNKKVWLMGSCDDIHILVVDCLHIGDIYQR